MQIGTLYEQAVELSPGAARVAVALLAMDADIPEPLGRALRIALQAVSASAGEEPRLIRPVDQDARAANLFLASCKKACCQDGR